MRNETKMAVAGAAAVIMLAAAAGIAVVFRENENIGARLDSAGRCMAAGDFSGAVAIYNGIIIDNSGCAEAYAGLAEAYSAMGRTEKAREMLLRGEENADDKQLVIEKRDALFPEEEELLADPEDWS